MIKEQLVPLPLSVVLWQEVSSGIIPAITTAEATSGTMAVVGLGAGLLIGNLISNSANTVDGLRVNIVTFDDQNFTIDVPKDSRFVSGSYVQINVTGNGYTQLTPITKEAYELVVKQQNAVRAGKYNVNDQQYYDDNNYSQQNSSSRNSSRSNLNDSDLYLD